MAEVSAYSVQKECEKHSHMKPEDIEKIKEWLQEQPHLPSAYISVLAMSDHYDEGNNREEICDFVVNVCVLEEIQRLYLRRKGTRHHHMGTSSSLAENLEIISAYHSCEYNYEMTKQVIDLNFTLRTLFTFYLNREINKSLEDAFRTWLITPLASPTNKGYRAIYCQMLDADPNQFNYSEVVKAFVMVMDLWNYEEGTMPGVVVIVNMDKVSIGHLSRIDLTVAQQFFYFLQEAMFVRLKEFHFINAPSFTDVLLSMVRPFMKAEMLDTLRVHRVGSNTLNDYIPLCALPRDAGGDNIQGSKLKDEIWKKIKANKNFFEKEAKKRVIEAKRPGKPKIMSTFFPGCEGSFKKLEID